MVLFLVMWPFFEECGLMNNDFQFDPFQEISRRDQDDLYCWPLKKNNRQGLFKNA